MILLIAYGNSLCRDDGAGPALARMIMEREGGADLRLVETMQLAPELAMDIAESDVSHVIFMDACVAASVEGGADAGDLVSLSSIEPRFSSPSFAHHFDASSLLAYAQHLYGKQIPAWLVTVPGIDFGYGEGFSNFSRRALASAVDEVSGLLQRIRSKTMSPASDLS